jgi:hypothetical protein
VHSVLTPGMNNHGLGPVVTPDGLRQRNVLPGDRLRCLADRSSNHLFAVSIVRRPPAGAIVGAFRHQSLMR